MEISLPIIVQFLLTNVFNFGFTKLLERFTRSIGKPAQKPFLLPQGIDDAAIPDIHGAELLKGILVDHHFRFHELVAIFGTETHLQSVLAGQTELTVNHKLKLAKYFRISPLAFSATACESGTA